MYCYRFRLVLSELRGFSVRGVLTSLLRGELHRVAGWALVVSVGHHHEHLVLGKRHQLAEKTGWLRHSAVEAFGLLLLADHETGDQTGIAPVVQLGWRGGETTDKLRNDRRKEKGGVSVAPSLTLYSFNSPWTDFRSTGFQWRWALLVSTFDTRRSAGASVGADGGNHKP